MQLTWAIIIMVVGALLLLYRLLGSPKKKDAVLIAGLLVLAMGLMLQFGIFEKIGISAVEQPLGYVPPSGGEVAFGTAPISTIVAQMIEKGSDSYTSVDGQIKFYAQGVDPTNPTASALETVSLTAGQGSTSVSNLRRNVPYHVIYYDNSSTQTWYCHDFGEVTLIEANYDKDSGKYHFGNDGTNGITSKIEKIATFTDPLEEGASTTSIKINGETTNSSCEYTVPNELCATTDVDGAVVVYNETGDAEVYLDYIIGATGGYKYLKDVVLCRDDESSSVGLEGNEYSSMAISLQSGTDFKLPSDFKDYIAKDTCFRIGEITGGQSGTYRFSATISEANLDTSDDWKLTLADLGKVSGTDIGLLKGATDVYVDFDSYDA